MSDDERITRRRSSDLGDSIILEATSKEFKDILGNDDLSSIVLSSILSNNDDQIGFYVNHESSKVIRPNIEDLTIGNCTDTTIGNKTFIDGPVTINVYRHDDIKIGDNNESLLEDSREKDSTLGSTCGGYVSEHINQIRWLRKKEIIVLLIAVVCLVIATFFTINIFIIYAQSYEKQHFNDSDKLDYTKNYQLTTVGFQFHGIKRNDSSDNVITSMFPVITRSEWAAQNPTNPLTDLSLPTVRAIIAHTGTITCLTRESCGSMVRSMQADHIKRDWDDIAYNFLVGGDGYAYVGRGWDKEGTHSREYNNKSICIAFIGKFNNVIPPLRQITAAQKLIEEGLLLGKLASNYRLYGHRQVSNTQSPGDALYAIIKKWDHWSYIVI